MAIEISAGLEANMKKTVKSLVMISAVSCIWLSGCATGPQASEKDPAEPFNRAMFSFNEGVDEVILKPVGKLYKEATPEPVRMGVSNFFGNLGEVWSSANHAMQLNGEAAATSLARVLVNSTIGIAGVFDVGSDLGLERKPQDFGQTLGHWGVGSGPYLVLPLLGPSTLRDAAALTLDRKADPLGGIEHEPTRGAAIGLRLVEQRAGLLRAGDLLDQVALDKYTFVREAYLMRRENSIKRVEQEKEKEAEEGEEKEKEVESSRP
jgi:phospholipid-binding lipoprotein MlaA